MASKRVLQFATFAFLLVYVGLTSAQNCNDGTYETLDDKHRSTNQKLTRNIPPVNDNKLSEDVWYHFRSRDGDRISELIPEKYVDSNRCGTEYPIFIRGTNVHNLIGDGETAFAEVCINHDPDNHCKWKSTILIHKCPAIDGKKSFYIYKLRRPPISSSSLSSSAYCAGQVDPCDDGFFWNGIICADHLPPMRGPPILIGPNITSDPGVEFSERIFFRCQVQYDSSLLVPGDDQDLYYFRITFLFDGNELEEISGFEPLYPFYLPASDDVYADLTETYLRGRLGHDITCSASSFYGDQSDFSPPLISNSKPAKIECSTAPNPYDFYFSNGNTQSIMYVSTLPLTCYHCTAPGCAACRYDFRFDSSIAMDTCALRWSSGTFANLQISVYPQQIPVAQFKTITFRPYSNAVSSIPPLWDQYVIPPCSIKIWPDGSRFRRCSSSGDPHVHTFDNALIHVYLEGDFYLSKAIVGRNYMEIQVRHQRCDWGGHQVTCNCGIIVREGNSALKVSYCGSSIYSRQLQIARLLGQDPPDSSKVLVDFTGRQLSIRMPSGLRVEVDASGPYMNFDVSLPPVYQYYTDQESMCGNCNDWDGDDLGGTTDEQQRFRIPQYADYFVTPPDCLDTYYNNPAVMTCTCEGVANTYNCTDKDPKMAFLSPANNPVSFMFTSGKVCSQDGGSSTPPTGDDEVILDPSDLYPPYSYDATYGNETVFAWPTPLGKTEEQTKQFCQELFESSSVYKTCKDLVNLDPIVKACVIDVQVADDYKIDMSFYTNMMQQQCIVSIVIDANTTDDGIFIPPPELDFITSQLCPNQCSGNGNCTNAVCECDEGFIGVDCSVNSTVPPILTGIVPSVATLPLAAVSVFGQGMVSSNNFTCRFVDEDTNEANETSGLFVTAGQVRCSFPSSVVSSATLFVSTSNDGIIFSNQLQLTISSSSSSISKCMQCSRSNICSKKPDTCLIDGRCFTGGEMNPDDTCKQCVPSKSVIEWTTAIEAGSDCVKMAD